MTTANQITAARLALTPVVVWLLIWRRSDAVEWQREAALAAFAVAAALDAVDGYVARRFRQQTSLGAWLDPLADKVLMVSVLMILSLPRPGTTPVPSWLWQTIAARDIGIAVSYGLLLRRGFRAAVRPRWTGKAAMAFQAAAALNGLAGGPGPAGQWFAVGAAALTAVSGVQYWADGWAQARAAGVVRA